MTNSTDIRRETVSPAEIGAGALSGLLASLYAVSFAHIVFGNDLAAFLGQGIWVALFGTLVAGSAAILRRPFIGTMWQSQSVVAVILGLSSAGVIASLPGAAPEVHLATVLALLAVTALLTGGVMLAIGLARLGQIAKSVPYPVVGGFLAATGWLLVARAIEFGAGGASD